MDRGHSDEERKNEGKVDLMEENKPKNDDADEQSSLCLQYNNYHQDAKQDHEDGEETESDDNLFEDSNVNILVHDTKSKISVQEYLCGRFLQVLQNEDFVII